MRVVLVCGDREWEDTEKIYEVLRKEHKARPITYLIEGGAEGVDVWSKHAAKRLGIQTIECDALWGYYGRKAGPIRNQVQLDIALALTSSTGKGWAADKAEDFELQVLAFHPNIKKSKGTADMVKRAKKAGIDVRVIK